MKRGPEKCLHSYYFVDDALLLGETDEQLQKPESLDTVHTVTYSIKLKFMQLFIIIFQ